MFLQHIRCRNILTVITVTYTDARPDVLTEMQQSLCRIQRMGVTVLLSWVPAQTGTTGNEMADRTAKSAATRENIEINARICRKGVKNIMKCELRERWQEEWGREKKGRW